MAVIALTLEYDGTDFVGWQRQPNGPSVQQAVESALEKLTGQKLRATAAGRTDAGVHALGQVASITVERVLPLTAYTLGMNALLPDSIAVRAARVESDDFDARRSASGKRYRYTIHQTATRAPLTRRTTWQIYRPLDVEAMARAAAPLVGRHDFGAFRAAGDDSPHSVREVRALHVVKRDAFVDIEIQATAFLRQMVRTIVGTLVEVGHGKRPPEDVARVLETRQRAQAGPTAPPQGLCLVDVTFGRVR